MQKILIYGNGQIGNFYNMFFNEKGYNSVVSKSDITNLAIIESEIKEINPDIVINTAAKTNLEWCDLNKLEAFNINVLGTNNVASICDKYSKYFIHLSSGCIFESKNAEDIKTESSLPSPASYYSWTKVWSENIIPFKKSSEFKYLILRLRQPISAEINYKNMLLKLLTFTSFVDTPNTGTVIEDLMIWTEELLAKKVTGIVNVANEGYSTPYKIALLLKKHVLPELEVNLISKEELDKKMPNKRVDTVLDVSLLKSLVKKVTTYVDRIEEIIIQLKKNFDTADSNFIKDQLEKTVVETIKKTTPNNSWKSLIK